MRQSLRVHLEQGAAYRRFVQRKGQGWRSLFKAQPLATVRVRVRKKTDSGPVVVAGRQGES